MSRESCRGSKLFETFSYDKVGEKHVMKIIRSFLGEKNSMLLSPKLGVLYNIFTSMLTTLQSESHYLYFTDVGAEDQKSQVM